jgi:hypothetical protein
MKPGKDSFYRNGMVPAFSAQNLLDVATQKVPTLAVV